MLNLVQPIKQLQFKNQILNPPKPSEISMRPLGLFLVDLGPSSDNLQASAHSTRHRALEVGGHLRKRRDECWLLDLLGFSDGSTVALESNNILT